MNNIDDDKVVSMGAFRKLSSALMSRFNLANLAGKQFGGDRDMYTVFGYDKNLTYEKLLARVERQDLASRVVSAPPDATWSRPPKFGKVGKELQEKMDDVAEHIELWCNINRADKLARIGKLSLLLLGFNDGQKLEMPVNPGGIDKKIPILYARPLEEAMVKSIKFNEDPTNERFGKPESYKIAFDEPRNRSFSHGSITSTGATEHWVHWTRVIHITDEQLADDITAQPTLAKVYNLMDDFLKIVGGTAETYWLTSNRGMQANIDKDLELDADDAAELGDEIEEYQHSLRRIIKTRGVEIKNLGSNPPNPKEPFSMLVSVLSGATGIPQRILIGSEAGQLASEQDRANWADRIDERRALYAVPMILRPFVKRLQLLGILPESKFTFEWEDSFKMSPLEDAQRMAQVGRTVANLSKQTGSKTPMQITSEEEAREIVALQGPLKARLPAQGEDDDAEFNKPPVGEEPEEPEE